MKLTFFLIAFFLVLLSVYFRQHHGRNDSNDGTMTISSDHYFEQIKWSGKVTLSEDEKSIAGMNPGGYLKFTDNDKKFSAESNLRGEISYELFDGHENLTLDDSGRRFVADALQKMIAWGFYAEGRPERIYKKGGKKALLEEIHHIAMDNAKQPYFDLFFKVDSLTEEDLTGAIKQINGWENDAEKERFLDRFTTPQLGDSSVVLEWLGAVGHIGPAYLKDNLLTRLIDSLYPENVPPPDQVFDSLLKITDRFDADHEKGDILGRLIVKKIIPPARFDAVLQVIGHLGADFDRVTLYKKLVNEGALTEEQWISLIKAAGQIGPDFDKSGLLVEIAQKMPKTGNAKTAYLAAAKTITNDQDYGKAVRAVE